MSAVTPDDIDELLPQTQCGLCGHGGCMPYAEAIVFAGAPLNLCPPGGVATLTALGDLMQQDVSAFIPDMQQQMKPKMLAFIHEKDCIGCTKCITACPVDAILGSGKLMHTVIAQECTGCELCVPVCPTDCITMLPIPIEDTDDAMKRAQYRKRFQARDTRIRTHERTKRVRQEEQSAGNRHAYIQAAIARTKEKKG